MRAHRQPCQGCNSTIWEKLPDQSDGIKSLIYFSTQVCISSRKKPALWHQFPSSAEWSRKKKKLKNNNGSVTIKLAHNESSKYIITMSRLVQYAPELPKTAHSDSSCPSEGPGLCSCISMSLSRLPGMVARVTGFWLRGTLITLRNEFPLGGRLGECKSREFGRGGRDQRGMGVTKDLGRVPSFSLSEIQESNMQMWCLQDF